MKRFVYSKAENHFYRICANIWILNQSFIILKEMKNDPNFTNMNPTNFVNLVKSYDWKTVIDLETVLQSEIIIQYYIGQKFYLSNYSKDEKGLFVYDSLKTISLKSSDKIKNSTKSTLEKKILLMPGEYVFLDD